MHGPSTQARELMTAPDVLFGTRNLSENNKPDEPRLAR
jgi:hypothetical protein